MRFAVDMFDTWNMPLTRVPGDFTLGKRDDDKRKWFAPQRCYCDIWRLSFSV